VGRISGYPRPPTYIHEELMLIKSKRFFSSGELGSSSYNDRVAGVTDFLVIHRSSIRSLTNFSMWMLIDLSALLRVTFMLILRQSPSSTVISLNVSFANLIM
jgi:hypothetical protein